VLAKELRQTAPVRRSRTTIPTVPGRVATYRWTSVKRCWKSQSKPDCGSGQSVADGADDVVLGLAGTDETVLGDGGVLTWATGFGGGEPHPASANTVTAIPARDTLARRERPPRSSAGVIRTG
jgi:hypothetical protein